MKSRASPAKALLHTRSSHRSNDQLRSREATHGVVLVQHIVLHAKHQLKGSVQAQAQDNPTAGRPRPRLHHRDLHLRVLRLPYSLLRRVLDATIEAALRPGRTS